MKLARWITDSGNDGSVSEGFVIEDLLVSFPDGQTIADVLAGGLVEAHRLHERTNSAIGVPLSCARLLPPLIPSSVRDFVAFEEHVEGVSTVVDGKSEVVPEWYQAPTFYFTNPHTIRATGEEVRIPETERLDFELELAAVIGGVDGSDGENLDAVSAADHIFGYTIMNDWSARDLQAREMKVRLGPAKGKDFATTLGPWIVTADEFEPFTDDEGFLAIRAEAYVNGALIGADLMSNMGWTFPELVAYASRNSVVRAGDVLGSGTVGNGGCLAELWGRRGEFSPPPLQPGDEVRMVIEGVGEIVNRVGERVPAPPTEPARPRLRRRVREDA
ncbi:fumarylacetoacetate hydrolase family protein [Microbacterium sp. A196]|uniref:fumarylacetoacetate hydrolase family protein n=1 Tax=Microbacterium sp. A196 TaxID=3457320 RepID=UPI003FD40E5B